MIRVLCAVLAACSMIAGVSHPLHAMGKGPSEKVVASEAPAVKPEKMEIFRIPQDVADISFLDEDAKPVTLNRFKGRVVMLNVWATWCAPCVKEMPAFNALQSTYASQGLEVVPLSQDLGDSRLAIIRTVQSFYRRYDLNRLPVYLDDNGTAYQKLRASGMPMTLILNREGKAIARVEGVINWQGAWFKQWLEKQLSNGL